MWFRQVIQRSWSDYDSFKQCKIVLISSCDGSPLKLARIQIHFMSATVRMSLLSSNGWSIPLRSKSLGWGRGRGIYFLGGGEGATSKQEGGKSHERGKGCILPSKARNATSLFLRNLHYRVPSVISCFLTTGSISHLNWNEIQFSLFYRCCWGYNWLMKLLQFVPVVKVNSKTSIGNFRNSIWNIKQYLFL